MNHILPKEVSYGIGLDAGAVWSRIKTKLIGR